MQTSYMSSMSLTSPSALDDRSQEIFRHIVDTYLATGEPLGSRTLARQLSVALSPASVRNVMSDLEHLGLIYAPHVSAGRLPTEQGLRYFVDGFMEAGDLSAQERAAMDAKVSDAAAHKTVDAVLSEASSLLSGLTQGAGLVIADKSDVRLRHIEFVRLEATKALVVMVGESGSVENRILDLPPGLTATTLTQASNYLNAHIAGRTLAESRTAISERLSHAQNEIDSLTKALVDQGLATWAGAATDQTPQLIIHGRANLLENVEAREDIDRLRHLFDELESREGLMQLLDLAEDGEGVRIFIGSENKLFSLSGSSVVVAPYRDSGQRIVGAVGVIGPTRLNYQRIVPVVDYTAQLVSRLMK
ncbi:heat-inducible transcriptional repressor HrcA [Ahrensia sp. R2A130]|uniref:heat-inducible transcriptional repressor HrcA n=1 Tax=Ahrensia sp. R2A130 TaxID=744979 RepID=UPI000A02D6B8|nr:heat-inducible transcriptional repressor HrcA [Ahrensia sp. R2A130]